MHCLILTTVKDFQEAQKIVDALMAERLVACGNIISDMKSIFFWQGKVDRADEVLLILKTRKELFNTVKERILSKHSYEVPEILMVSIESGHEAYLQWIDESIKS